MKKTFKTKSALGGLISGLLLMVAGMPVARASLTTVPIGLNPGDQYRLVFVTDGISASSSANISTYNSFVTAQANSVLELSQLGTTWNVIGSTLSVSARANTGTDPSSAGVAVYSVGGQRIATSNSDLWNGTIENAINVTQTGVQLADGTVIITGTTSAGVPGGPVGAGGKYGYATLGSSGGGAGVRLWYGLSGNTDASWSEALSYPQDGRVYAMSGVLTVAPVPEPTTILAGALLLLPFGASTIRILRKRHHVA
jgi:hypothetical protein